MPYAELKVECGINPPTPTPVTPTPTPTPEPTPTPTPPTYGNCYSFQYTNPAELDNIYVRYRDMTDTVNDYLITSGTYTVGPESGVYTSYICVYPTGTYTTPVCVFNGVVQTDCGISGNYVLGGTCLYDNECFQPTPTPTPLPPTPTPTPILRTVRIFVKFSRTLTGCATPIAHYVKYNKSSSFTNCNGATTFDSGFFNCDDVCEQVANFSVNDGHSLNVFVTDAVGQSIYFNYSTSSSCPSQTTPRYCGCGDLLLTINSNTDIYLTAHTIDVGNTGKGGGTSKWAPHICEFLPLD